VITFNGIPAHSCKNGTPIAGKAASCTQNGWKDYYRCSCGKFYADQDCTAAIADLTAWKNAAGKLVVDHTYGGWISTDPDNHWKECACGAKAEQGSHLYDNDADTSCNTCGYKRTIFGLSNPSVDTDKGEIKLTLAFDNTMSGNVMVAVYDSFGRMIGISYVDESVTIDSTGKTFTVVYDKNSVPYMVKAFLLNTGFMPVIAIDSLKIG
jgi:hypothetical protein